MDTGLHIGNKLLHIRLFECHDLDVAYTLVMLGQGGALTQILCLWCCYEKLGDAKDLVRSMNIPLVLCISFTSSNLLRGFYLALTIPNCLCAGSKPDYSVRIS